MTFDRAIEFILQEEGGLVSDPADPGGVTNWGISHRAYPSLDIVNLSRDDAKAIYKRDYWDKLCCEQLPNGLDLLMLNAGVTDGNKAAATMLQTALHSTKVDGIIGPITIDVTRHTPSILTDFLAQCMYHYALVPQILKFGRGWYARLARAAQLAFQV